MKRFAVLLLACFILQTCVEARDYVKLHAKEMRHSQKYSTTKRYVPEQSSVRDSVVSNIVPVSIKDPKLLKFYDYEPVSDKAYQAKLKKDESDYTKYEKSLKKVTLSNYNAQARGGDYYRIYRVAERLIRANNLGYINWRIGVERDTESVNAYATSTNYVCINTALLDTFKDNDDALALVIGHEMAHNLFGHQARLWKLRRNMAIYAQYNDLLSMAFYTAAKRKWLIDSKNAEYAADVEGAKLALKAGYNLDNAEEVIRYFDTLPRPVDWKSDHPDAKKRMENLHQNERMFVEDEWSEYGKSNIYHSDVLKVEPSSDRKSIVILKSTKSDGQGYMPETPEQLFLRSGYKAYVNGQFAKSVEYFDNYLSMNNTNPYAYLYASYAAECLYKNTNNKTYLKKAQDYIEKARAISPEDKYIKEQTDSL